MVKLMSETDFFFLLQKHGFTRSAFEEENVVLWLIGDQYCTLPLPIRENPNQYCPLGVKFFFKHHGIDAAFPN